MYIESLPAWECGLKSHSRTSKQKGSKVTPCVGVWIEISGKNGSCASLRAVTPCVGVWIEICTALCFPLSVASLPAWECGLK